MNYIKSYRQTDEVDTEQIPDDPDEDLFAIGAAAGFVMFLISLVGVYWLSQVGVWDIAKLAGFASLVLGLASVCIFGGGNLAVRIGRWHNERKQ